MKFTDGTKYGHWTFKGEYTFSKPVATCHLCGKRRSKILRFELPGTDGGMIEYTELGTECVNNFEFNQTNPYTNKHGVNTATWNKSNGG